MKYRRCLAFLKESIIFKREQLETISIIFSSVLHKKQLLFVFAIKHALLFNFAVRFFALNIAN